MDGSQYDQTPQKGTNFFCVIYNRRIYHKSVKRFDQVKYSVDIEEFITPVSNDYFLRFWGD